MGGTRRGRREKADLEEMYSAWLDLCDDLYVIKYRSCRIKCDCVNLNSTVAPLYYSRCVFSVIKIFRLQQDSMSSIHLWNTCSIGLEYCTGNTFLSRTEKIWIAMPFISLSAQ